TPCAAIGRHRRAWNRQARPARRASPLPALLRGRSAAARPGEAPQERAGARAVAQPLTRESERGAVAGRRNSVRLAPRTAEGRISANPLTLNPSPCALRFGRGTSTGGASSAPTKRTQCFPSPRDAVAEGEG